MVLDQIGSISNIFEPNKTVIFEYSFPEGGSGQFDPPSYLKKNLSNINTTLYNY